jgi:hypothetical protein
MATRGAKGEQELEFLFIVKRRRGRSEPLTEPFSVGRR